VQTEYSYDPFGATTTSGAASGHSGQYTGRENDQTGLFYYRARYYSPTLQRFISEDPSGFGGGDVNLYAYVTNGPTNFMDPQGLEIEIIVFDGSSKHSVASAFGHVATTSMVTSTRGKCTAGINLTLRTPPT